MSYSGPRRAPNVSQYLANLNTIPTDIPAQNDFAIDDTSLDFLTNAEFFDFDNFNGEFDSQQAAPQQGQPMPPQPQQQKRANMGVHAGPGYQFGEFQTYPSLTSSPTTIASPQNLQGAYPPQHQQPFQPSQHANSGDKRKASAAHLPSAADLEEVSRMAAEEDKRRRNTAASARFRVKKKQREQALEKQAKEMSEKVQMLEGKVQQLEMENKWLKELITEKGKEGAEKAAEDGVATEEQEEGERSTEKRSDGVGTADELKAEA